LRGRARSGLGENFNGEELRKVINFGHGRGREISQKKRLEGKEIEIGGGAVKVSPAKKVCKKEKEKRLTRSAHSNMVKGG